MNKIEYDERYYIKNKETKTRYHVQWRKDNPRYMKEWYKRHKKEELLKANKRNLKNKEDNRKKTLKRKYSLSHENWLEIWKNQSGKCAICGEVFNNPSDACVDHNHETGKVRGLLCKKCNLALGLFNDDIKNMMTAVEYLEKEVK